MRIEGPATATAEVAEQDPPSQHTRWWWVIAIWTLPALIASYATYVSWSTQDHPISFWRAFATQSPGWYVWVPLTPVVFALARRFPLVRRPDVRAIAAHLALMIAATALYTTVYVWANMTFRPSPLVPTRAVIEAVFVGSVVMTLVLYAATLATSLALDYASRDRERERRTLALEAQLARAELHTLRAQLHPHVLFNSLHTIALLARRDADEAIRVTVLLGNVLRSVLDSGATDERPLRDEIALIEQYLAIELVRFADRLTVEWEIDPTTHDALVPTLLLQPLVENALRHGIARSVNGGSVVISAHHRGDTLDISVWNTGPGLTGGQANRRGVGLRNTEERLQRLYGNAAALAIGDDPRGGVVVRVALPWNGSETAVDGDFEDAPSAGAYARYSHAREPVANFIVTPTSDR